MAPGNLMKIKLSDHPRSLGVREGEANNGRSSVGRKAKRQLAGSATLAELDGVFLVGPTGADPFPGPRCHLREAALPAEAGGPPRWLGWARLACRNVRQDKRRSNQVPV